jgi:hypothetical protein
MHLPDKSLPRDGLVLLSWLATTACLAALAPLVQLRHRLTAVPRTFLAAREDHSAAELKRLDTVVERGLWSSETLGCLHADAADAIEAAEDDFEHLLATCAAVMTLPPRGLPVHDMPEADVDFEFLPIAA